MFDSLSFMDFEDCKFLRQVPDLSGLPNLRALCLDNCTNLDKVHGSIGFLDKLILLSAQGCIKLHTFLHAINLPSLETLDLRWCTSLQSFPEVLGMMENIREVYLDHTAVEELPISINKLVGLERLYIRRCERLNQLPSSIRLLPKLEVIFVYKQRGFQLYEPDKAEEAVILKLFICPRLDVQGSHVSFSKVYCASIRDYSPLESITLPTAYTLKMSGSSVSFWFRKRFPEVTVLLIAAPIHRHSSLVLEFRFCVLINGINQLSSSCDYIIFDTTAQPFCLCVFLGDFRYQIEQGVLKRVFSVHDWNHVEVSWELKYHRPYDPKWVSGGGQNRRIAATIEQSSLHVGERNFCMKDIRFANPDCQDSTSDTFCRCNSCRVQRFGELVPEHVARLQSTETLDLPIVQELICEVFSREFYVK